MKCEYFYTKLSNEHFMPELDGLNNMINKLTIISGYTKITSCDHNNYIM